MRKIVLLWILYFLQGIPYGFQTKFLPVFLRSYSLSLTLISLTRLLSLPWLLKPLWAPLVDKFGTKISWIKYNLVGMSFCYFAAWYMSFSSVTLTVVVVACLNCMAATQDIAVDSLFVDYFTSEEIGLGNIAQVVGYKTGSLFGGGVLGWLSSSYPWQQLFFLLFIVYMTSAILVCSPFFINLTLPQVVRPNNIRETLEQRLSSKLIHSNSTNLDDENVQENRTNVVKQLSCKETATLKLSTVTKRRKIYLDASQQKTDSGNVIKARFAFLKTYLDVYQNVLKSDGTKWTIFYVLIYKLGEQGMIAIFPMFLLDQGLSSSETAILTGVLCQFCSIFGSLLGGMLFSTSSWEGLRYTLSVLSTVRFSTACVLTWLASLNVLNTNWIMFVIFDCLLHLLSGMITTVTFTLMITCSQKCPRVLSATHYSNLSTFEVLGKLCMVSISGTVVDMIGYMKFFIICTFLTLLPIFLLRMWNSFGETKVQKG